MIFRQAKDGEETEILTLYRSVVGTEFCSWNEFYPGMEEIRLDMDAQSLYLMAEDGEIIGACSVAPQNELDDLPFWTEKNAREIARVVVAPSFWGNGLAKQMVEAVAQKLEKQGYGAIHLSVYENNIPAMKTYQRVGFAVMGKMELYQRNQYYLLEKLLGAAPKERE